MIDDENVNSSNLLNMLTKMHDSNILLDKEAITKLQKAGFKHPVDLANYCFKSGWNEAIKTVLQMLRSPKDARKQK